MPKFAANLSFIFQEVGFLERFAAAAACGFQGIEYLSPYEYPPEVIAEQLKRHGLEQALFNMPPGDWAAGERGIAALPGREQEFRDGVETALTYAKATNCRLVHAMAGLVPEGSDRAAAQRAYVANLRHAAERLAPESVTVVIEPINNRDIPGYYLNTTTQAMQVIGAVGHPNLKLQLDLYHVQIMEGDLAHRIRALAGRYPHVQIAGNPGRHEPDVGEINYPFLFDLLDELGYSGWIGCEYRPKGETRAGLGWARRYGIGG
ncbi:MAG: hydroxypyruvate isomerase family protein [Alphaproteobacteria bacterium]|nr:MAG: hydroxypyruvate isomerase family protein [Alphaproteobacteria bacterium]